MLSCYVFTAVIVGMSFGRIFYKHCESSRQNKKIQMDDDESLINRLEDWQKYIHNPNSLERLWCNTYIYEKYESKEII